MRFFIFFATITHLLLIPHAHASQTMYLLKIKPPSDLSSEPWCGIYGGRPLSFSGNMAIIKDIKTPLVFSLLITNDLTYCQTGCTIRYLSRRPGAPIRWFDLSLKLTHSIWQWEVMELTPEQIPLSIPYHAIIFFFDPELIEGLKMPVSACCSPLSNTHTTSVIFEFPTIVLKNTALKKIKSACQEAHLSYLDIRGIIAQATSIECIIDSVVLKQTTTSDV